MKKVIMYAIIFLVIIGLAVLGVNLYVKMSSKKQIVGENDYSK